MMKRALMYIALTVSIVLIMSPSCTAAAAMPAAEFTVDVGESLRITAGEIKADVFSKQTGATGEGIVVAIIDTGVDPAHPDLNTTPGGRPKIIDWVDFTGEGRVGTTATAAANGGLITTGSGGLKVGDILSKSGVFHYGFLSEKQLDETGFIGRDLNRDGDGEDRFAVVVVDSTAAGIYDTVYVDTDQDMDITDEKPLGIYSKTRQFALFTKDGLQSSFVVAGISVDGNAVDVGFDGNGHGTHVAGILGGNGKIKGIAPGVEIMALKALGSSGDGFWDNISRAMDYAAANGADIVSISIGSLLSLNAGDSFLTQKINNLSVRNNVLFVVAAGNDGPGIGSSAAPGNAAEALTVGAYISPAIWKLNYNSIVENDGLWDFSAMGPRRDGALTPDVIAPGSAMSSVCIWDGNGYFIMDGTSMAVPHVAGAAALLMQQARREGISYTYRGIKTAIEQGARPLEGFLPVEQGHGLVDVERAWQLLLTLKRTPKITAGTFNRDTGSGPGVFLNSDVPSRLSLKITNVDGERPVRLTLTSDAAWVVPDRPMVFLPRGKTRTVNLIYNLPSQPGIYSTIIKGDDPDFAGVELEFPVTVIVPKKLNAANNLSYTATGRVAPARWERRFVHVPYSTAGLSFSLTIPKDERGLFKGRARMYVINPEGRLVFTSEYAGPDLVESKGRVEFTVENPTAGVWEAVIYADPASGDYGLTASDYTLNVQARGIAWQEQALKITAQAGAAPLVRKITVKNLNSGFTGRAAGAGLAEVDGKVSTTRIKLKDGDITGGPVIQVPENALKLEVWLKESTDPKLDADLYLYYYDEVLNDWEEIAQSVSPETARESVELVAPRPGRYMAYVDGYSVPGGTAELEYGHRVLEDSKAILVEDTVRPHPAGDTWTFDITVSVPNKPGRYLGYLFIRAESGETISYIPVEVQVSPKQLDASVFPGSVTPDGRRFITVTVHEKSTAKPYSGIITVDGRLYEVVGGRLTLLCEASRETVNIVIDMSQAGYYNKTIEIN